MAHIASQTIIFIKKAGTGSIRFSIMSSQRKEGIAYIDAIPSFLCSIVLAEKDYLSNLFFYMKKSTFH